MRSWRAGTARRRCRKGAVGRPLRGSCRGGGRFGALLLALGPFDLTPARDIVIMGIEARRKRMAAGAVGDEIEVLGLGRLQHGLDRRAPGIGDRSWRQAVDLVGVVRGLAIELLLRDGMIEHALAANQAIDDGRVGL